MQLTAEYFIEKLNMQPHKEGGWFGVATGGFGVEIPAEQLPSYSGARKSASIIYYLLKEGERSNWHLLHSEEVWAWQYGGTLKMSLGGSADKPVTVQTQKIGIKLDAGELLQARVPAKTWQTTKLIAGDFALVSCTVSPAFDDDDFLLFQE